MDVYLERIGAEGVHKRALTDDDWRKLALQVQSWTDESLAAALASIGVGDATGGSSVKAEALDPNVSIGSPAPLSLEQKERRRLVTALVERSRRVFGVVWASLPEELRAQAAHVPQGSAPGLWHWLQQKFQNTEQDSVGELLAQWVALRQEEDESFDAYRARVNQLKALLEHAKEPQSARMHVFTLLDKLQPRYKQAVLALKAGGQLKDADKISWDMVAAFVNQHERSEMRLGADNSAESAAMAAAARGSNSDREGASTRPRHFRGRGGGNGGSMRGRGGGGGRGGIQQRPESRTCFRCDQKGHVAANCAQPPKATTSEQASAATCAPSSTHRFDALSSDEDGDDREKDERTFMTKVSAPPAAASQRVPQQQSAKAATQKPRTATVSLDAALADDAWGWDTMASSCCSGNRARFASLKKCAAVPVKVADGSIVGATHIGSVPLRVTAQDGKVVRIMLENVLYHERFVSNLLSGELLTKKLGWQYHSTPEDTYAVTPGGHRVPLSTRGRVAVMMGASTERACGTVAAESARPAGPREKTVEQLVRLHERCCHMGFTRMMNMLHGGMVEGHGIEVASLTPSTCTAAEKRIRECVACVRGRATRTPFGHRGLDRGTKAGECLHLDTYQVKVEREGRMVTEYGLVIKDMYSGHVWHERVLSKDEVADVFTKVTRRAETQFSCRVKRIYADGGTEFINQTLKAFCDRSGKELHWTPARTQQLNGGSERTVRTFKDSVGTMTQHAGAPVKLWGRAATHAAFVWNRTHIAADTRVTPYEAMRGKKPSLTHLTAVWGCDAYCHVPREQRGALEPKSEPCIYVGHNEEQNAAHVLLLSTKKIICSRDVTYRSGSFTFMRAIQRGDDGVREAMQTHDAELSAEVDSTDGRNSAEAQSAPAQGGRDSAVTSLSDAAEVNSDPHADAEEWTVESIVGQRKRNGRMEYKVHWAGFSSAEDTWEPAAEVSELSAMDVWQAQQQQPLRRSPRTGDTTVAAAVPPRSVVIDGDDAADEEPQVHMAMSALRSLQLPEEMPEQAALLSAVTAGIAALELQTPQTYRQAMASPDAVKWKAALDKEIRSCNEQEVWRLVPRDQLPPGANVLPCKEVFKIKVNEHGDVTEHKARVTPKGYRQKRGVDFFDTFARTGQYKTLRVALSLVAKWNYELAQFDVPTAFLNAPVEEDIYMELPEGYEQPGMVCKLQKSLYGLKQAPRNWDILVHTFITSDMGFRATVSDPSFYFKRSRTGRLMLIYRFVDDMQGSYHAEDAAEFHQYVKLLQNRFRIKQLHTATWMLGMRISRDRKMRTITLSQELYVTKALERFGLQQCRSVSTPEAVGAAHDSHPALDAPADAQRFMEMTGTLMYAAISTRPDIAHAVHYLASHMQVPTKRHMLAAERVLRYLAGTKDLGLVFGSRNGDNVGDSRGRRAQVQVDVCAFADADWANDKGDRKSISGWVAKLNGDPVSWSSKKQRVVALSTCEAELYAEAAAIQEVLWLRGLMEELGLHTQTGSIVYGDNQSTLAISQNGVKGERTKHVDVKYHFVTETVERGAVKLRWVPTTQQQADIFTKALAAPVFELLRNQLMSC
jgi:transposase InsO family protein